MSCRYSAKVPPGLMTLLEGLSRSVVKRQPESISQFATFYFAELLHFRTENPTLAINDLVREFNTTKVPKFPSHGIGAVIAPLAVQNESATAVSPGGQYVQPFGIYPPDRIFQTLPSIPGVVEQDAEQPWVHSQNILYTGTTLPRLSGCKEAAEATSLPSQYLNDSGLQRSMQAVTTNVSPHPISADQAEDLDVFRRKSRNDCMTATCDINSAAPDRCRQTKSAFPERVPLSEIYHISNAVLIRAPSVPCEYMIVVQSDKVPKTMVFQRVSSVSKTMRNTRTAAACGDDATGAPGNTQPDCTPCFTPPTAPSQVVKDQPDTQLVMPLALTEDTQLSGDGNKDLLTQPGWNPLSPGDNSVYKHMDINIALPDPNAYNPYINEMIVDQMNWVNEDVSTMVSDDIIAPGIMVPVNSALQDGCFPSAVPDVNGYNPYMNEMILDQINGVNFGVLSKVSDEMTCVNVMGPPISAPLDTKDSVVNIPVCQPILAPQEASAPSLVYPPTSAQETCAPSLVYPPTSAQETCAPSLVYPPTSAQETCAPSLVYPPTSAQETCAPSLVYPPTSAQETCAPSLVYPPNSAQETCAPSLVYPPTPQVTVGATFMPPSVSPAGEISVPSLVYPPISAGQGGNIPSLVLPPIYIAQPIGALPLLSTPIVPPVAGPRAVTLPNPYVPAPQKTTATLLYPSILAQEETIPPSLTLPQAIVAHLHQCTGQNAEAFHVNEENRRTPYVIPLVYQSIMGVPQMYVQPQQHQFIPSWSREAHSQRLCDPAPTGAMPECQYVTPEACGRTWRCIETMAGMPTVVAFPGGSRIVIGCGQEQGYNPDQANLPMCQDFGPCFRTHHIFMGGASSFQTLCPMSGAYMPVMPTAPTFEPTDHRCCQGAPDVTPPHYVVINSPTHNVASYPTPSPMQPQGFASAPVHMYGPCSETENAVSSTFNVKTHAAHQQGRAEHCRETSNMLTGENPYVQNYSGI
uniref:uncharacterized protein LOC123998354 isoform X1 n=2 Tax=Oncorhynchus gorbuscha TaxID=8017 RepID=UPI001EAEAB9C|nr:uncharacterized protein LOC123998354 isoform X1 [Oncorhynchus gorbuscha]